jgi:hypothetical protein
MADALEGRPLPRAMVPAIALRGPKISRSLSTEWFARRVEERQTKCLARDATGAPGPTGAASAAG